MKTKTVTNDPYRDWYQVYLEEVIGKPRHWPANVKVENTVLRENVGVEVSNGG